MTETTTDDILAEVWNAKDSLSAKFGHNLAETCRSLYVEQAKTPERFVSFGGTRKAQQGAAEQSATAPQSKPK